MADETDKLAELEQRLAVIEKSEKGTADNVKWGVDILKWGLGVFAAVAIASAGFNSWTANRNYERDKEAFEKRLALLTQQVAADNDKEITGLRKQSESSFLSLSNSFLSLSNTFQSQFNTMRDNYIESFSNAWIMVVRSNMVGMMNLASNNDFRFNFLVTNLSQTLSNRDVNFGHTIDMALMSVQTNVAVNMDTSLGQSLMLKGSIERGEPKQPRGNALATAAYNYIGACRHLYAGRDKVNLRRCLGSLADTCLQLVHKTSKVQLMLLVTKFELADVLKLLIEELKKGNVNRRYDDSITTLQMYLQVFEGKLPAS